MDACSAKLLTEPLEGRDLLLRERITRIVGVGEVRVERGDPQTWRGTDHLDDRGKVRFDDTHPAHSGVELQVNGDVALPRHLTDRLELFRSWNTQRDFVIDGAG